MNSLILVIIGVAMMLAGYLLATLAGAPTALAWLDAGTLGRSLLGFVRRRALPQPARTVRGPN